MSVSLSVQGTEGELTLDVRVDLPPGVTGVLGANGSGKTTLLQAIAGLVKTEGDIVVDGTVFQDATTFLPPEQRRVGLVFDDLRLFSHLSVRRNVRFGATGPLHEVIALLQLHDLLDRRVPSLTHEEKQRVAVARALAMRPRLLALDEGLTRGGEVVPWLRDVVRQAAVPTLLVSSTPTNLLPFTHHLLVLKKGRVVSQGDVATLVSDPLALPVLHRLGLANVFRVTGLRSDRDCLWAQTADLELCLPEAPGPHVRHVALRPSDVLLANGPIPVSTARNVLAGTVRDITGLPDRTMVLLDVGVPLIVEVTSSAVTDLGLRIGQSVTALIQPGAFRWL
ncbi:MAG: ATP-binding cassette domain-containing protein [Myxococcota bacterium]